MQASLGEEEGEKEEEENPLMRLLFCFCDVCMFISAVGRKD